MELIQGKWYKYENNYYKFDRLDNGFNYFSEYIYNNKWRDWSGGMEPRWSGGLVDVLEEIYLSEIQQFLPLNHSDLMVQSQDYSYLIGVLKKYDIR